MVDDDDEDEDDDDNDEESMEVPEATRSSSWSNDPPMEYPAEYPAVAAAADVDGGVSPNRW